MVEEKRTVETTYPYKTYSLEYKMITNSRKLNQIFHQAQVDRLMLNRYLYKIKCSVTETCRFDGEVETQEHFFKQCEAYKEIWKGEEDVTVNELLDDRKSNYKKAETAKKISKALTLRKKNEIEEKSEEKSQPDDIKIINLEEAKKLKKEKSKVKKKIAKIEDKIEISEAVIEILKTKKFTRLRKKRN